MIKGIKLKKLVSAVLFAVLVAGVLATFVFASDCTATMDPCEKQLQDCNHACGEGVLAGICKEKCTYDYNQCKGA